MDSSSRLPLTAGDIRGALQGSKGFGQCTERLQAVGHVDLSRRFDARAPQLLQAAQTHWTNQRCITTTTTTTTTATYIVCIIPHQQRSLHSPQVAPWRQHALRPTRVSHVTTRVTSRACSSSAAARLVGAHLALGCSK
jgi:hypothetical protein